MLRYLATLPIVADDVWWLGEEFEVWRIKFEVPLPLPRDLVSHPTNRRQAT